jgi:hypothetical protein
MARTENPTSFELGTTQPRVSLGVMFLAHSIVVILKYRDQPPADAGLVEISVQSRDAG